MWVQWLYRPKLNTDSPPLEMFPSNINLCATIIQLEFGLRLDVPKFFTNPVCLTVVSPIDFPPFIFHPRFDFSSFLHYLPFSPFFNTLSPFCFSTPQLNLYALHPRSWLSVFTSLPCSAAHISVYLLHTGLSLLPSSFIFFFLSSVSQTDLLNHIAITVK